MKKIIATMIKEWLLMRRDIPGLLLLLIMPAALIIVMAVIQDAPFKDYQDVKFELLLTDNDHGSLARQITDGLKHSKNFHITDTINGKPVTEIQLKQLLNKGDYKIGIVIPTGVTAEIVNSANIVVNDIAKKTGIAATLPAREMRDQVYIRIYFDPVSKPTFRAAISAALDKYITYSCTNILMQRLSAMNKDTSANTETNPDQLKRIMQGIGVKEEPVNDKGKYNLHINSVQHNVPAWAIFGMFFIVVPIAGQIIREREDGSALRIALIPNVTQFVGLGRILFYMLICALQFMVMLCIGLYAMPSFGLPALYPGTHAWLLLPVALCIGFAASTYGYFVGTLFRTITQALPFGAVSVVILSALGGIWVPIEILPAGMQHIALASPLHWSLDAVNQVILRNGDINAILLPCGILLTTGILLCGASFFINTHRARTVR
jgi:ABC-2 type transport system permease protein